jgi:hypothetical protein
LTSLRRRIGGQPSTVRSRRRGGGRSSPPTSVNSRADATTELGAISDPGQVAGMIGMLLGGPVDQRVQPAGEQPAWLLAFHLRDGTATVRADDPGGRRVQRGIGVPRRFGELVQAVAS